MRAEPEFNVGQRVSVILNEANRTPHAGLISRVVWHHKLKKWIYFLEENGKKVQKCYFAEDLEDAV
jgi:hypothetical protein